MTPTASNTSLDQSRPPAYLILQCVGWGLYGLVNTLFFSGFTVPAPRSVFGNLVVAGTGFALSHLLRKALRPGLAGQQSSRAWIIRLAVGIPVCASALALVTAAMQA